MDNLLQVKKTRLISLIVALIILVVTVVYMARMLSLNQAAPASLGGAKPQKERSYEGRIMYIGPNFYPNDGISYVLEDSAGNDVILLKSDDQKLEVSEGLAVIVYGRLSKTMDSKKEILLVERIVVKDAPN